MNPPSNAASSSPAPRKGGFDAARHGRDEDHLNRWPFAREIFRIAADGPREWSVRIGVYGEWGSGKTSVLRFVESMAQHEGHIIFPFNPWQFQSADDLWKAFVKGIFSRIEEMTGKQAPGELARQGKRVAAGAAKALPTFVRLWNSEAGNVAEKGLGFARKYLAFSDSDLKDLAEILGERRLIVTVDDLDRTDAQLVPEILFALKEIMDVPGVSFVCAFDPVVVGQVLGRAHPGFGDGLKFLEKIIDYPRWLSEPSAQQLADLALSDAGAICPYVPNSDLSEAVALLPKNPRAIRQFIRLLGLLRPQIERHHPKEIQWSILLAANVLKVRFPKIAHAVLSDNAFWESIYSATVFGEEKENKRRQAITEKIEAVFPRTSDAFDDDVSSSLGKCISVICSRLNAWRGLNLETLFYQFRLAESPDAVTWKEFDSFVSQMGSGSDSGSRAAAWITSHSEEVGQSEGQVYSELLSAAIRRRAEHLSSAADAMPGKEMNAELDRAARMLQLIEFLMFRCERSDGHSYAIEPFHLTLLFEQVGQFFGWRRTPKYRAARREEKMLLTRIFKLDPDAIEPWIDIIGIRQWEGRHEDRGSEWKNLIVAFRRELKERCSRWLIRQIPKQHEFLQHVVQHEKHGHRYRELFFDRSGPIWTRHRKLLLRSFGSNPSNTILQNNAYELLTWLKYLIKNGGGDGEAAKGILSNADFALQLWRACVVAPLNPRAVGSLREAHDYLVSVGIPAKIPMWWKQIVEGLLKPPA